MASIGYLDAYHLAIDMVKKAGFVLDHVSMQTETCYFVHPARAPLLLRVSTHKSKHSPIGMSNVVARVSFTVGEEKHYAHSPTSVRNRVTWAIGHYFMAEQKPSEYRGKRGTWEAMDGVSEC